MSRTTKNPYLELIEKHLREIDMPIQKLYDYFKKDKKSFREGKNGFPSNPDEQEPFPLGFIAQLVLACDIDPELFLLDELEMENWEQLKKPGDHTKRYVNGDNIKTEWSPEDTIKEIQDLYCEPDNADKTKAFVENYTATINRYMQKADEEILVYEFLGKGDKKEPGYLLNPYQKAHRLIFEKLESHLEQHPNIRYRRILALPMKDYYKRNKNADKGLEAIKQCSVEGFKHIIRSLYKFGGEKEQNGEERVVFCVGPAARNFHFGVLTGVKKMILEESYRYVHGEISAEGRNILVPDILSVKEFSHGKSKLAILFEIYRNEINRIASHFSLHLSNAKTIKRLTEMAHEDILKQVSDFESNYRLVNMMEQKRSFIEKNPHLFV